jgi:hypothetical protein
VARVLRPGAWGGRPGVRGGGHSHVCRRPKCVGAVGDSDCRLGRTASFVGGGARGRTVRLANSASAGGDSERTASFAGGGVQCAAGPVEGWMPRQQPEHPVGVRASRAGEYAAERVESRNPCQQVGIPVPITPPEGRTPLRTEGSRSSVAARGAWQEEATSGPFAAASRSRTTAAPAAAEPWKGQFGSLRALREAVGFAQPGNVDSSPAVGRPPPPLVLNGVEPASDSAMALPPVAMGECRAPCCRRVRIPRRWKRQGCLRLTLLQCP